MTDWNLYRKCPVCFAPTGEPCWARTGLGSETAEAPIPHSSRKPRLTTRPRPNGDH